MKNLIKISALFLLLVMGCGTRKKLPKKYETKALKIEKLSKNTFIHTSYLKTKNYGDVPCNGLIFIENREAIVFDTPTNDSATRELLEWIEKELKCKIKAVVINHFHVDCLGGLNEFHKVGINSYANISTIELAKLHHKEIPKTGFVNVLQIEIGNKKVINKFFGQAHTKDNIVSYIPSEKVLFGGCLIKAMNAKKGNLKDANVKEWSNTMNKIKREYSNEIKYVIPGHGKYGGSELFDYTVKLFGNK